MDNSTCIVCKITLLATQFLSCGLPPLNARGQRGNIDGTPAGSAENHPSFPNFSNIFFMENFGKKSNFLPNLPPCEKNAETA
jgi:hypothetical protein